MDEVVEILKTMVNIPSYPGIENQEAKVAQYIKSVFDKEGIKAYIDEIEGGRCNVIAKIQGDEKGKSILLTGHTDTVDPYGMENPLELIEIDENLYGRGAVDMKGALAAMMMAMIEIKRSKIKLKREVVFAGVIDEEHKSRGTIDFLEQSYKVDMAIVGEPSNFELCLAHRGLEWFELEFEGKTVHGGKQDFGINAIQKAGKFIETVERTLIPKLKNRVHPIAQSSTMNYGTINGGTQPSTVAGNCTLTFDRRWIPGEDYSSVCREYQEILDKLREEDKDFRANLKVMDVSLMKDGYTHEPMIIEEDHILVKAIEKAYVDVTGKKVKHSFFPAWSDGGLLYTFGGIPTVVFGPGELESAHSSTEHIPKSHLYTAVQVYKNIVLEICS